VKAIQEAVYRLIWRWTTTPLGIRLFLRWFQPVTITPIISQPIRHSGQFYAPQPGITTRIQAQGKPPIYPLPETFPAVGWRIVDDATVINTRHFPYLVRDNHMMIGNRRVTGPWQVVRRGNRVAWQDGHNALVKWSKKNTLTVDRAIYLGGRDFTNWYHWLVDALPQLHLADRLPGEFRQWPVLVPEQIFRFPTMVEALNVFVDGREVIHVPEWHHVRGTICWIDSLEITNVPASLSVEGDEAGFHILHREGMNSYRREFLDRFATPTPRWGSKIFLIRAGNRRPYNQDEIAEVAARFGFEAVAPEVLSLAEQVQLFSHARHIIGPSGAGFAGLLFSSPGTKALCWQDSRITNMTILPDLAELAESTFDHVFYDATAGGIFTSTYHLDPDWFALKLQRFLDSSS